MHQIRRGSLKFEAFKSLAAYAFEQNVPLLAPNTSTEFVAELTDAIRTATNDDKFIFGHRTEAMFAAMVACLGSVIIIKQEDGSDCFAQDAACQVPDFRVVLGTGDQMLIEAKNFHPIASATAAFQGKAAYLDGLIAYAALMKCDLRIAIYWSRWNLWTLNRPDAFSRDGEWFSVALSTAMMGNEMSLLGDKHVGTKMPLKVIFEVEQLGEFVGQPNSREFSARIKSVYSTCAGVRIVDEAEKKIATYLMLFGDLALSSQPVFENNRVIAIEHEFRKEQKTYQGFELVGSLSSMFCLYYRHATSGNDEEGVTQIHAPFSPGALGKLIPDGYQGIALPLWQFIICPNTDDVPVPADSHTFAPAQHPPLLKKTNPPSP